MRFSQTQTSLSKRAIGDIVGWGSKPGTKLETILVEKRSVFFYFLALFPKISVKNRSDQKS